MRRLPLLATRGGYSLLCEGFSLQRLLHRLWARGLSSRGVRILGCVHFSSCDTQTHSSQALELGLSSWGTGLSCSEACEIFPGQRSNLCPLNWQADSCLLHHQGSPKILKLILRKHFGNWPCYTIPGGTTAYLACVKGDPGLVQSSST